MIMIGFIQSKICLPGEFCILDHVVVGILEVALGPCAPVVAMGSVGAPGQMEFVG